MAKGHGNFTTQGKEKPSHSGPTKSTIHKGASSSVGQPRPNLPGPGTGHEKGMC